MAMVETWKVWERERERERQGSYKARKFEKARKSPGFLKKPGQNLGLFKKPGLFQNPNSWYEKCAQRLHVMLFYTKKLLTKAKDAF